MKNDHIARVRAADQFHGEIYAEEEAPGVAILRGRLRGGDDALLKIHAYQFAEAEFDPNAAKAWLKKRGVGSYTFEPAGGEVEEFAEIRDMEVFEAGEHRGKPYTNADLDTIIENHRKGLIDTPLVVGHSEDQKFLRQEGLPAGGWLAGLKRVGSKLLASWRDVPNVIAKAIESKQYKKRSAELYPDYAGNGLTLRRVALLGADIPEVKSLSDAVALTYDEDDPAYEVHSFDAAGSPPRKANTGDNPMPDKEDTKKFSEEQTQALVDAAAKKAADEAAAKFSEENAALKKERDALKAKAEAGETAAADLAAKQTRIDIERFCEKLTGDGKLPPAIVTAGVVEFMETLEDGDDVDTIKFGEGDKAEDVSPRAWFKAHLESLPKLVEFSEVASDANAPDEDEGATGSKSLTMVDGEKRPVDPKSADLDAKATKYAEKNNVSYEDALVAVDSQ